jgi:hypothetical protein
VDGAVVLVMRSGSNPAFRLPSTLEAPEALGPRSAIQRQDLEALVVFGAAVEVEPVP